MAVKGSDNPHQPGSGKAPPVLAGRGPLLAEAEERLDAVADGKGLAQNLLFYGPRGTGKTAPLGEIRRRTRNRGLRVEELPVNAIRAEEKLVRHLQERAGALGDQVTGINIAGVGVAAARGAPTRAIGKLFTAWIRADGPAPVIVMDEIHALSPEAARPFLDAVESAKGRDLPFLLVAAGTPDATRRLREAATCNERAFEPLPVGRLRRPETITALAEPARRSGLPMSEDAAALLAEESQDYPFFIQLLGSAAWKEAAAGAASGIGLDAARRGVEASRPRIARFYSARYDEAWDRNIAPALAPLASLFVERGGQLASWEMEARLLEIAALDSVPMGAVPLRDALRDLGVCWEATAGIWEMGIPSFADFVLRRTRPPR